MKYHFSRIQESFSIIRSIERGEPQPTALNRISCDYWEQMQKQSEQVYLDALKCGTGYATITATPPKLEHIPIAKVMKLK